MLNVWNGQGTSEAELWWQDLPICRSSCFRLSSSIQVFSATFSVGAYITAHVFGGNSKKPPYKNVCDS